MPYARTAVFWFIGLLGILVIGFWPSYFSILFSDMDVSHHFHGLSMLAWVLLLIHQAWRVRRKQLAQHRRVGQLAWVIAPLVVISGILVTFHNIALFEDPTSRQAMRIYHVGWYSIFAFAVLFSLAMKHRRNVQFHARYMTATALVFLIPGLGRALRHYVGPIVGPIGIPVPDFYQSLYIPLIIGLVLLAMDWRGGRVRAPWAVFTVIWLGMVVLWHVLPELRLWQTFTVWSASL